MITLERIEPIDNGISRLLASPLEAAGNQNILIYKDATARLCDFFPDELNLTSLYVLKRQLERLREIRAHLITLHQIDILRLDAILHLRQEDGTLLGMAPPFVEIYEEQVTIMNKAEEQHPPPVTLKVPILKDGIHRAWIAREEKIPFRCLLVHGALREHRPYAYPNAWDQVQLCEDKPTLKKYYRRAEPYSYMRPLKALRQVGDKPAEPEWNRKI